MRTQSTTIQEFSMLKVSVRDLIRTQSMQMNSLFKIAVYQDMIQSQESKPLSNYKAESRNKETLQEGNLEKLVARIQERNRALSKFQ